ncbi:phosphoenolpyruvate synthase [candidate division GN15 bacterium]|nr:phosphoenolpyruvate synthase [candidate division GN15 bacterium]
MQAQKDNDYIRWFEDLTSDDVLQVGGKNASLGEMIAALKREGIRVPDGFATTAEAYRQFLSENDITDKIAEQLQSLKSDGRNLEKVGQSVRRLIKRQTIPKAIATDLHHAYDELSRRYGAKNVGVAVRSSATAEDLPEASFAGQQETFLNVTGKQELIEAVKGCYASLFTDRAIAYRQEKGFDHMKVALSAGVQKMVRSDKAGSGVMFTIDTETGFDRVIMINAAWGLGETVVQGTVNPDEYAVFKPLLFNDDLEPIIDRTIGTKRHKMVYGKRGNDTRTIKTTHKEQQQAVLNNGEIMQLARWGALIERHYQQAMDIEWAKDGDTEELYIVQARPETVQSQKGAGSMKSYRLTEKGKQLASGLAIGQGIATGKAQRIDSPDQIDEFETDAVLVTDQTDPDWVPVMKRASAIVTDSGGRTSHAAIVSRELGMPAVVGTEDGTRTLEDGEMLTVSCAEGDNGYVYRGELSFEEQELDLTDLPRTRTSIRMNIASPAAAFRWWRLPADGIGLARLEFVINNIIKVHPLALVYYDKLKDKKAKKTIAELTAGYEDKTEYFVDNLARGIAHIAAAQHPHQVLVRLSDFKTNEYADLLGGAEFEHDEENPMLGFRGASRYYSERYRDAFALECQAVKRARETIGLDNVAVMIPFCRTVEEADQVLTLMADHGLVRGARGLAVYVMAEIPSNVVLADQFARRFDGFSIGSNDLTQLVLGVDRDSEELSYLFDETNDAVRRTIAQLISTAHKHHSQVSICGQAPSDYPDFAAFLVREGIDSISLNPDSVIPVLKRVARVESQLGNGSHSADGQEPVGE